MEIVTWRKSRRSTANGGNCVEVAENLPGVIRDSKDPHGPRLTPGRRGLARLVADIKAGRYTR